MQAWIDILNKSEKIKKALNQIQKEVKRFDLNEKTYKLFLNAASYKNLKYEADKKKAYKDYEKRNRKNICL